MAGEEVRFRGVEALLERRLLLTGYHGDKMWDPQTRDLSPHVVRWDPSGSSLMEYRLWAGFIHCPVPFWGVRQIRDVNAISKSDEMKPWDVGGEYSRPICRRIVEGAGVPRGAFGVRKRGGSRMLYRYDEFLTPTSMDEYLRWIRSHRFEWLRHGRVPPLASAGLDRCVKQAADVLADWLRGKPAVWRLTGRLEERPTYLRRCVFPWAVEAAKRRYADVVNGR